MCTGSVVFDYNSGKAVALHLGDEKFGFNVATPSAVIIKELKKVQQRETK